MMDLLQLANILVIPAFGYIIVLERRITQLQTQLDALIRQIDRVNYTVLNKGNV